ncbi:MAG TPA: hypothetical protein VJP02_11235 [Candidatus Sulfotelmatobacter sp.]|nr:hypothetical protein [Candidatus Sulfotelmatobacter sp.]
MKIRNVLCGVCGMVLAFAAFLPMARADEWNQMTKLSFSQPVEIPGSVLPAGTYWFKLADAQSRNVVEIFNSNQSKIDATLITVPEYRLQSTDHTEVEFAERPHDKPEALLTWYYPGTLTGHEFLYSSRHENAFARDIKEDVMGHPFLKLR